MGHVIFSPPFGTAPGEYTSDWALYEMHLPKSVNFSGNVIDLGGRKTRGDLLNQMNPNDNPRFRYPSDRPRRIQNTFIPLEEIKHPRTIDESNEPCFRVLRRGKSTGVTVGVANEVMSYTRSYREKVDNHILPIQF